jgi:hypothetical protein
MNIIRRYKEMIKNMLIGTVLVLVMVASAGATVVRVDPASQTVVAGDPFYVNVAVEDVDDLKGNVAILNFDPGAMQVTGIVEGDFLKAGGSTIGIPPAIDNTAGTAMFAYTLSGASVVSGGGALATIEFDTYSYAPASTYDLSLTGVELRNASNDLISRDVVDGTVTILSPPVPVPVLSRTGMIVLVGMLAIVLAIRVTRRRRK